MEFDDSNDEESNNNNENTNIDSSDISYYSKIKNKKWIPSDSDFSNLDEISESESDENSQSINKENKSDSIQDDENDENSFEKKKQKKSYTFIWNEEGEEVKIAGSFSGWKEQYKLIKDPNDNIFKLTLKLNCGKYQYKYIVDGDWKCAEGQPKITDEKGITNNILEIENSSSNKEKTKKNSKKKNIKNQKSKTGSSEKSRKKDSSKKKYRKKSGKYNNKYPAKDGDANTGMTLPNENFGEFFNLDNFSRQNKILTNKLYLKYQKQENYSSTKSYSLLFDLGHINLNHLFLGKSKNNDKSKNINRIGINYKFRYKTSTFIYYNNKS